MENMCKINVIANITKNGGFICELSASGTKKPIKAIDLKDLLYYKLLSH